MTYLHRVTCLAIVILTLPAAGLSQWTTQSGGAVTYTGGSVGIGTTTPGSLLQVGGNGPLSTASPTAIQMDNSYFDGVGTSASLKFYLYKNGGQTYGLGLNNVAGVEYHSGMLGGGTAYHAFYTDTTEKVRISNAGNVGIGTTTPRATGYVPSGWLDTEGGIFIGNGANVGATSFASTTTFPPNGGLIAVNKSGSQAEIDFINLSGTGSDGGFAFYDRDNPLMRIMKGGNVGIGTLYPQYPLSVNGIVQAKEVIVNTGWSDYVFDANYRLAPLTEVAAYVNANHHLPGMPAADDVAARGIGVGEIESKLLAKIEELTLHMIEADRENRALRERVQKLESGQQK